MRTDLYAFLMSSCVASGLMLRESYSFVSATIVVGQYPALSLSRLSRDKYVNGRST